MSCSFCDSELSPPRGPRPAPSPPPAGQAAERLDDLLARLRQTEGVDEGELMVLAWECFAAGFAARRAMFTESDDFETVEELHTDPDGSVAVRDLVASLSPRRLEVLRLVAKGLTNSEIANVLDISACTVKAHVAGILQALDLTNRTEAAVALREYESTQVLSTVAH